MNDLILVHHGIKGQKWGVRRYRNKDGTLTAEGRSRAQKQAEREANDAKRRDYKQASKNRRTLSDEELMRRIGRLEMEKKLKDLTDENLSNRPRNQSAVKEVLIGSGKRIASVTLTGAAMYLGRAVLTGQIAPGVFNIDEAAQAAAYIFPNPNKKK